MKLKAFHSYQELCDLTINHNPPYPPIPSGHDDVEIPQIGACCSTANDFPVGGLFRTNDALKFTFVNPGGPDWMDLTSEKYSDLVPCGGGLFSFQTITDAPKEGCINGEFSYIKSIFNLCGIEQSDTVIKWKSCFRILSGFRLSIQYIYIFEQKLCHLFSSSISLQWQPISNIHDLFRIRHRCCGLLLQGYSRIRFFQFFRLFPEWRNDYSLDNRAISLKEVA